jgi:hypothetical protein
MLIAAPMPARIRAETKSRRTNCPNSERLVVGRIVPSNNAPKHGFRDRTFSRLYFKGVTAVTVSRVGAGVVDKGLPAAGRRPHARRGPRTLAAGSGYLSLPRTTSGNIDDEVHRESAEQRAGRTAGSADGPVNPYPGTDVFGIR